MSTRIYIVLIFLCSFFGAESVHRQSTRGFVVRWQRCFLLDCLSMDSISTKKNYRKQSRRVMKENVRKLGFNRISLIIVFGVRAPIPSGFDFFNVSESETDNTFSFILLLFFSPIFCSCSFEQRPWSRFTRNYFLVKTVMKKKEYLTLNNTKYSTLLYCEKRWCRTTFVIRFTFFL